METLSVLVGVVIGITAAVMLFRLIFDSTDEFWECVSYCLKPDLISLFMGEYDRDVSKSFKVSAWGFLSGLAGVGSGALVQHLLG